MKKVMFRVATVLVALLLVCIMVSCSEQTYTVTFVLGDGREDVVVDNVLATSPLYVPESTDDSKVFAGWFTDKELTHPFLGRLFGNTTLYARFIERGEFVVTFVYGNGSADTTLVMSGALTEPTAPTKVGYVFMGWENAATGEKFEFGTEPTEAHTVLVAKWRAVLGGVSFTAYPENGSEPTTSVVAYNAAPTKPKAPKRTGYYFTGWYADAECSSPYDFTKPIVRDTAVYAGWTKDIAAIGNEIAEEILPATVKVHTQHVNTVFGMMTDGYTSIGSGVIFSYRSGYYYLLTNQHVIAPDAEYTTTEYFVYDSYGNEYRAQLAAEPAAEYDLAVLRFSKGTRELGVAKLSEWDVAAGSMVVSVGNPDSVMNSVTYGTCLYYKSANVDSSNVSFEVGWHDAPISNGSSGGAVYDSNLKVIGINYAANTDSDYSFKYGVFVPISRVREYLRSVELI